MRSVRVLSVVIALAAIAAAVVVTRQRAQTRTRSAVITQPAPELGPEAHILLPDLDEATVVVPDRPHDPSELRDPALREKLQRVRTFTVSTNHRALRGPPIGERDGPRILCVGDSVTFGWGVAYADAYPTQLGRLLGIETINAGVPAMKPSSIAKWVSLHAAALAPDLVLFARRPDYSRPDPWKDYEQALRQLRQSLGQTPYGIILPPISTFDPRGVAAQDEELARATALAAPAPVLDLTPAFRAALPKPGVTLRVQGNTQQMVAHPSGDVIAEGAAPPMRPGQPALAAEITDAFEADHTVKEPLFFDGGHPDAEGFTVFAQAVAAWLEESDLLP